MPKPKQPGSNAGRAKLVKTCGKVLKGLLFGVFKWNIQNFFGFSCAIYLASALALMIERYPIDGFFCAMELPPPDQCETCQDNIIMCKKTSTCYRAALNITWQSEAMLTTDAFYQDFTEASSDIECNGALANAETSSPVDMILKLWADQNSVPPVVFTSGCRAFHCKVLKVAIRDSRDFTTEYPEDVNGSCTNTYDTKQNGAESDCICGNLATDPSIITSAVYDKIHNICPGEFLKVMCNDISSLYPWCPYALGAGGSSARMLDALVFSVDDVSDVRLGVSTMDNADAHVNAFADIDFAEEIHERVPKPGSDGEASRVDLADVQREPGDCRDSEGNGCLQTSVLAEGNVSLIRRLTAPQAGNSDLPEYTTGPWSNCHCYMQCIPGVRERLVECLEAAICMSPMPATAEPCVCKHCALCDIDLQLMLLMYCFYAVAGVTCLVFLCYLYMANMMTEDDLIYKKIRLAKKLVGMWCKALPPLIRLAVLANFGQIVALNVMVWIPRAVNIEWSSDCLFSSNLRVLTIVITSFLIVGLILGFLAKKYTRKPPWLYVPDRMKLPPPLKQIKDVMGLLGP